MRVLLFIAWLIFILIFPKQGASTDTLAICTTLFAIGVFWPGGDDK